MVWVRMGIMTINLDVDEDDGVRLWRMKIGLVKQKTMTMAMTINQSCKKRKNVTLIA